MSMNSRGKEVGAKKEDEAEVDDKKLPKIITSSSSSRQWSSSFKNPRIVRVSRTFGGKDRHSKVCTVRGLRDRRIRLSVPTAIQLYDLQDRLGLSQPSKVIDWLLDATKHEIDKLPPLPIIPTNFLHFHQPLSNIPHDPSPYVHDHQFLSPNLYKNDDDQEGFGGFVAQLSAHNFFPLNTQFSVPYNFQLDTTSTPNLSLSQFGGGFSFSDHHTDQEHSSSTSQIYMCPSATATATTPNFPHYIAPSMENHDQFRQINHLQNMATTLHLINPTLKSFTLNDEEKDNRSS